MKKILPILAILIVAAILRFWALDRVPVSLFGDELDVGYQAYSIAKTGKDYSGNPWPLHFQSLAEWRTPLYLYSAVPTVALFGITPWGVRLPAAIAGVLGVLALYLLIYEISNRKDLSLVGAGLLALSPWHIQYSRAGFEVSELLLFLILGVYFFLRSFKDKGKSLWIASLFLAFSPWIYSTAKLFVPLLVIFLLALWMKEIRGFKKSYLIVALITFLAISVPITYSTLFGGGAQRFSYISIVTDPTTEPEVGTGRLRDALMRGEHGSGLTPEFSDRVFHNKFVYWGKQIINNYFDAFSTNFLFTKGDLNARHSVQDQGELYKVEVIPLLLGVIFFLFLSTGSTKTKLLVAFWILAGVIPSAITREGGNHATRLILILPPLIILVAHGLVYGFKGTFGQLHKKAILVYLFAFLVSFIFYQHKYWVHYPWDSERWWHSGFGESIKAIKEVEGNYDKVVISTSNEPPWIFFAGWYEFPPDKWHKGYPFKKTILPGFGEISYIDKYYFGSPEEKVGIYNLSKFIDEKTLYLAVAKEVGANLVLEPSRVPDGLTLIKPITYPSGEPAFYIFSKD